MLCPTELLLLFRCVRVLRLQECVGFVLALLARVTLLGCCDVFLTIIVGRVQHQEVSFVRVICLPLDWVVIHLKQIVGTRVGSVLFFNVHLLGLDAVVVFVAVLLSRGSQKAIQNVLSANGIIHCAIVLWLSRKTGLAVLELNVSGERMLNQSA